MISVRSFILRFSEKYKKHILRLAELLLLFICLILAEKILEYFLVVKDGFTEMVMADFYGMEENIDNLYLGSSHVHYNIIPEQMDAVNGENNFNLSTGLQPLNASYYLLREASKRNKLSHVYVEISVGAVTGEFGDFRSYEQLPNTWRVLNYVKPSWNKLQWMVTSSKPEYWYLTFFPAVRYHKEAPDTEHWAERLKEHTEDNTTAWNGGYRYKGYRWTDVVVEGIYIQNKKQEILEEEPLSEDAVRYLTEIMEYCKKKGIKLTFFTSPISDCEMCNIKNYDHFSDQIKNMASEYGVSYWDFNLCKREILDLSSEELWRDNNHLNQWGAEQFTEVFGRLLAEESGGADIGGCFYDSYEEKLQESGPAIYGFHIDDVTTTEQERILQISTVGTLSDPEQTEYIFWRTDEEGENRQELGSENGDLSNCAVPLEWIPGVLHIEAKNGDVCRSCRYTMK